MQPTLSAQRKHFVFTSESVSEGHPDKVCDQISDVILDTFLTVNPEARVAAETLATTNLVVIAGETRGTKAVPAEELEKNIRAKIREIGYEQDGFHWETVKIENHLHSQSADIAMGVDADGSKDEGAGDQGIMFGFACNESDQFMPATISIAHDILLNLSKARHSKEAPKLQPDAKSQVTLEYVDGKPVRAKSIVVSTQHQDGLSQKEIREMVRPYVMKALPNASWMCEEKEFYVNPTGNFVIGGPDGDTGLTGRKIIVDTYGGAAPHGGGAFSGKDPTKVDRSAAYAARYLAKNVVASGVADRCLIQLSYAIGVSHPISFYVNTAGTSKVDESRLEQLLQDLMNLTPRGIREHLKLNRPIYAETAAYGHFGRAPSANGGFSWENCDLVDQIRRHFN